MNRYSLPLLLFFILSVLLVFGFSLKPLLIPSPLLNKPLPSLHLSRLDADHSLLEPQQLKGRVWLLNIWASWCSSCHKEHPQLIKLNQLSGLALVGLIYKDEAIKALDWLDRQGNPYSILVEDPYGTASLDLGVYGTPETYLIDKKGILRYKHIGPISDDDMRTTILPLITQLQAEH